MTARMHPLFVELFINPSDDPQDDRDARRARARRTRQKAQRVQPRATRRPG